ncbi:MAG: DUF3127 domain-containing protein, partial [Bacteroidota bacterium]|nr:DUF3127 domain-containing protein [Bacteroidota bacterium]
KGREYNGRWYNDLRVWRIAPAGAAPAATPAYAATAESAPAPTMEDMPSDFGAPQGADEDFPF